MASTKETPNVQVAPYYTQGNAVPMGGTAPSTNHTHPLPKKNTRAYRDIAFACFVISCPMVVLSAALLGLIYKYRLTQTHNSPAALQLPSTTENDASAYLVDFSATRLVTIASWTSSVAPFLPGFVLALLSFPAARRVLRTSQASQDHGLPTPFHLALYLQLLEGNVGSLWQWLKYKFWNKREKQVKVITNLVAGLIITTMIG